MHTKYISIANPQGKASIAVLNDIHVFRPFNVKKKDAPQWLTDYFTSLLILSSKFSFKPIINKNYYMYFDNNDWKLSLIEPQRWKHCPYTFFASCNMHDDKSWSITPIEHWETNIHLYERISAMKKEFFNIINSKTPIIDLLPYYAGHLPYYQRLAANALANSLKQSLELSIGHEQSQLTSGKQLIERFKNVAHPTLGLLSQN
jgi:hypothetical protein|tara:strand:+ start:149 stop:757 length:609 start_codon:yes stop_codon:yes gene_type:complete